MVTLGSSGFVIDAAPHVAPVDANGVAEFQVYLSSIAADFNDFSVVQNCVPPGPVCAQISALTLDSVRYRLLIDYNDPTFTNFIASFIGQTTNNSMVFATLNSVGGGDAEPDPFFFLDETGVELSTTVRLHINAVTPSGMTTLAPISVTGGEYSLGCTGSFTSASGTISPYQPVCVRHTSAPTQGVPVNTTLTIGGIPTPSPA